MCNKVDKQKLNLKRRENLLADSSWKVKDCNIVTNILANMRSVSRDEMQVI